MLWSGNYTQSRDLNLKWEISSRQNKPSDIGVPASTTRHLRSYHSSTGGEAIRRVHRGASSVPTPHFLATPCSATSHLMALAQHLHCSVPQFPHWKKAGTRGRVTWTLPNTEKASINISQFYHLWIYFSIFKVTFFKLQVTTHKCVMKSTWGSWPALAENKTEYNIVFFLNIHFICL